MIITIDGPAASGKSSVARALAERLQGYCLSSGMLYRAVAYLLVEKFHYTTMTIAHPKPSDVEQCIELMKLVYSEAIPCGMILVDGADITSLLKTSQIDQCSSIMATNKFIREKIDTLLRTIAHEKTVVAEGRDMGSVVFPEALVKFYLMASPDIRARRWQLAQRKKGKEFSDAQALQAVQDRDMRDSGREVAPLISPLGAIVIDNSSMNLQETIEEMMNHISALTI
jgi:cytidylate kinase